MPALIDEKVASLRSDRDRWLAAINHHFIENPLHLMLSASGRSEEDAGEELTRLLHDDWHQPILIEDNEEYVAEGPCDFVYDRKTGLVFRSLSSRHEYTMATLQGLYEGIDMDSPVFLDSFESPALVERYMIAGNGAYFSSVDYRTGNRNLRCSDAFIDSMSVFEFNVFRGYKLTSMFKHNR